ncbi:hypothetical protein [Streptomyces phage phiScoe10]|nr:hypothetical protein [Streptomyces phage phiScoe10]
MPMEEMTAQEIGAQFAAQVLGGTVSEGSAPADSPLGKLQSFAAAYGVDAVTPEHVADAREGRLLVP